MAINKVVFGNDTLIDLTDDSVSASNLLEGETAHDRSGASITGTAKQGHIIQNVNGTDLTQRAKLQFADADVTDDSTNQKTIVNVVRERTQARYDAMPAADKAKGIIEITDADAKPLFDTQVRHGDTTVNALLNQIGYLSGLRFKNLGTSFTAEQQAAIASGDFTEFWNGDYWEDPILGKLRIVDNTDYFFNRGNPQFAVHGLVVMPDDYFLASDGVEKYINDTNDISSIGYAGCKYRTTYRSQCRTKAASFFGDAHIATYTTGLCSQVSSGNPSDYGWYSCDVELPTMQNMIGTALGKTSVPTNYFNYVASWGQFRLFQLSPKYAIPSTGNMALRDAYNNYFARLSSTGIIADLSPSNTAFSIRPFFIII